MLPDEERALREVRSDNEAADFIRRFWERRDPDTSDGINPAQETFWQRVEAADRLYEEDGQRGSLTVRGGVLVLFGSAPVFRLRQQAAPALTPARPPRAQGFAVTRITIEEWEYHADGLPPYLAALVRDDGYERVIFKFLIEEDRTRFVEGEEFLDLAAIAAINHF